jgi:hypothetical protein
MDPAKVLGIMGEGREGECAKRFTETDKQPGATLATFWQQPRDHPRNLLDF